MAWISWSKYDEIAFSYSDRIGIFIYNIHQAKLSYFIQGTTLDWAPAGNKIAFSSKNLLFIKNRKGWLDEGLDVIEDRLGAHPKWSPTDKSIVYTGCDDPSNKPDVFEKTIPFIKEFDFASRSSKIITQGEYPCWSPNAKKIAFCDSGIKILNLEKNEIEEINFSEYQYTTENQPWSFKDISWSPKGDKLLLIELGVRCLYTLDFERKLIRKFENVKSALSANWSPDGERIVFMGKTTEDQTIHGGVYIMDSDGSNIMHKLYIMR